MHLYPVTVTLSTVSTSRSLFPVLSAATETVSAGLTGLATFLSRTSKSKLVANASTNTTVTGSTSGTNSPRSGRQAGYANMVGNVPRLTQVVGNDGGADHPNPPKESATPANRLAAGQHYSLHPSSILVLPQPWSCPPAHRSPIPRS